MKIITPAGFLIFAVLLGAGAARPAHAEERLAGKKPPSILTDGNFWDFDFTPDETAIDDAKKAPEGVVSFPLEMKVRTDDFVRPGASSIPIPARRPDIQMASKELF